MRDQRLDLAGRVDVPVARADRRRAEDGAGGGLVIVSVTSLRRRGQCRRAARRCARACRCACVQVRDVTLARRPARNAALPTRSSRFVVIRPSRNGSLASSAWWIGDVRDDALDDQLVERDPRRARSRPRAVGPQTIELPEQRVVERRDLVAGVEVGVHPDARAARRRGSARRRRRRAGSRARGPRR